MAISKIYISIKITILIEIHKKQKLKSIKNNVF
jgi:hypothetical protein